MKNLQEFIVYIYYKKYMFVKLKYNVQNILKLSWN